MRPIVAVILGVAMGGVASELHLLLLRRALARAEGVGSAKARQTVLRGFPLRLLVTTPFLGVAAANGLFACVGLVLGMGIRRWLAARSHSRHRHTATA